jgi:hypothetical protein
MSTLEGWCAPTDFSPEYADHTFVYCPDNGKYFGCWANGRKDLPDAAHLCTGTYKNAYAVANCYRHSVDVGGHHYPDTAGIGIYGVNGVCHQSANCFLYAADTKIPFGKERPRLYWLSVATYGFWGTGGWTWWWAAIYFPCRGEKDKMREKQPRVSKDPLIAELQQAHQILIERREKISPIDVVLRDTVVCTKHFLSEVDSATFAEMQRDYLKEREALIRAEKGETLKGAPAEALAKKLDDLLEQFQKSLAERLDAAAYEKLTGLKPNETGRLIDPRIIRGDKF